MAFRCAPYYTHSALYPVIDHLKRRLQFSREDSTAGKLDKLERVLGGYHWPRAEVVPLFAALLSLPAPALYPRVHLSPQRQRQQTQAWLLAWLLEETARHPVLAVWEDLHWVDPSTLELLGLLMDQLPSARLLILLTARPEFRLPWHPRAYLTQLTLTHLSRPHVEAMITQLTGGTTLPAEVVEQIVTKSDGVPLYVEEMTKAILGSGVLRQADGHYELVGPWTSAIPTTLQDLLMARLDCLATAKGVALLAATIGRHFPYEWLHAVSSLDEAALQRELGKLMDAELVYQRGIPPQATYTFKHALIQEATYQSLLKRTRQQYHHRIAQVLEARFPATIETQPELLAHHNTEAGLGGQAVNYWLRAGQRALERSAHQEAMSHLTKGLEVLTTLPESAERTRHELDVLVALGIALIAIKGQAAPDVERVYARARELGRQVEKTPHLFPVLFGLWGFYEAQGKVQTARELAEQLLILAQHLQDSALLLEAHHALGATLFWHGEVAPARAHLEQGIALFAPQQHRSLAFRTMPSSETVRRSPWPGRWLIPSAWHTP
jgi:predicted ATPase